MIPPLVHINNNGHVFMPFVYGKLIYADIPHVTNIDRGKLVMKIVAADMLNLRKQRTLYPLRLT